MPIICSKFVSSANMYLFKHLLFTLGLIIPSHFHTHLVYSLHDYAIIAGI